VTTSPSALLPDYSS